MIRTTALAALLVSTALCTSAMAQTPTPPNPPLAEGAFATSDATDPFLWLEEVVGERAMAWFYVHNQRSLGVLQGDPRYAGLHAQALHRHLQQRLAGRAKQWHRG